MEKKAVFKHLNTEKNSFIFPDNSECPYCSDPTLKASDAQDNNIARGIQSIAASFFIKEENDYLQNTSNSNSQPTHNPRKTPVPMVQGRSPSDQGASKDRGEFENEVNSAVYGRHRTFESYVDYLAAAQDYALYGKLSNAASNERKPTIVQTTNRQVQTSLPINIDYQSQQIPNKTPTDGNASYANINKWNNPYANGVYATNNEENYPNYCLVNPVQLYSQPVALNNAYGFQQEQQLAQALNFQYYFNYFCHLHYYNYYLQKLVNLNVYQNLGTSKVNTNVLQLGNGNQGGYKFQSPKTFFAKFETSFGSLDSLNSPSNNSNISCRSSDCCGSSPVSETDLLSPDGSQMGDLDNTVESPPIKERKFFDN